MPRSATVEREVIVEPAHHYAVRGIKRSFLDRPGLAPVRRQVLLAASIYLLLKARRLVEREGVKAPQARLLTAWPRGQSGAPEEPPTHLLDEIDHAIDIACQWLP